jgi:hypothetical protein
MWKKRAQPISDIQEESEKNESDPVDLEEILTCAVSMEEDIELSKRAAEMMRDIFGEDSDNDNGGENSIGETCQKLIGLSTSGESQNEINIERTPTLDEPAESNFNQYNVGIVTTNGMETASLMNTKIEYEPAIDEGGQDSNLLETPLSPEPSQVDELEDAIPSPYVPEFTNTVMSKKTFKQYTPKNIPLETTEKLTDPRLYRRRFVKIEQQGPKTRNPFLWNT